MAINPTLTSTLIERGCRDRDSLLFLYVRPRIEPSTRTLLCIAVTAAANPLGAGSVGGGGVDDFIRGGEGRRGGGVRRGNGQKADWIAPRRPKMVSSCAACAMSR